MERVEDQAFGPLDRIGQLTMRNLDIDDSTSKLHIYGDAGPLEANQAQGLESKVKEAKLESGVAHRYALL